MKSLAIAILLLAFLRQADTPPVAVPVTPEPPQIEWRLGFDLGNMTVIETPELNPQHDPGLAVREADKSLGEPPLSFGLGLLPFARILGQLDHLVNPRQWTIIDLKGVIRKASFHGIGVFMGTMMRSEEGGYHLVSVDPLPSNPFIGFRREASANNLIIAFAGTLKHKPDIGVRVSETNWQNLKPVLDPEHLPPDYDAARKMLARPGDPGVVFGTSIEAYIHGVLHKVWLLNFGGGDPAKGNHPWGIFEYDGDALQPLYLFKSGATNYYASLDAAIDLDQDGSDELIVEEEYRNGTAFQVLSLSGKNYEKIYHSYFRGTR